MRRSALTRGLKRLDAKEAAATHSLSPFFSACLPDSTPLLCLPVLHLPPACVTCSSVSPLHLQQTGVPFVEGERRNWGLGCHGLALLNTPHGKEGVSCNSETQAPTLFVRPSPTPPCCCPSPTTGHHLPSSHHNTPHTGTQMVACMYSPGRQAILESDFATTAALGVTTSCTIQVGVSGFVWRKS